MTLKSNLYGMTNALEKLIMPKKISAKSDSEQPFCGGR